METGVLVNLFFCIIEDVLSIATVYVFMVKILLMLPNKQPIRWAIAGTWVIAGNLFLTLGINNEMLRLFFYIITILMICIFCIRDKLSKCIVKALFALFFIDVLEECIVFINTIIAVISKDVFNNGFISKVKIIFSFVFILFMAYVLRKNQNYRQWVVSVKKRYYVVGTVCLMNTVFISTVLDYCSVEWNSIEIIVVKFGQTAFALSVIILYVVFAVIDAKKNQYFEENILKDEYLCLSKEHYNELEVQIKEIRRIKHDLNSQYIALKELIEHKDFEKAKIYLEEIVGVHKGKTNGVINTGNDVVDAVLRGVLVNNDDIVIIVNGSIGKVDVSDFDLCTIFSNLFKNAIEAVSVLKRKDKKVTIDIKHYDNSLLVKMTNPIENKIDIENIGYYTTKENSMYHGFGIGNVKNTVKKYDGEVNFAVENEEFCAKVVLFSVC